MAGKEKVGGENVHARLLSEGSDCLLTRAEAVAFVAFHSKPLGRDARQLKKHIGNQLDRAAGFRGPKSRLPPIDRQPNNQFFGADIIRWARQVTGNPIDDLKTPGRTVELSSHLVRSPSELGTGVSIRTEKSPDDLEACHKLIRKLYDQIYALERTVQQYQDLIARRGLNAEHDEFGRFIRKGK